RTRRPTACPPAATRGWHWACGDFRAAGEAYSTRPRRVKPRPKNGPPLKPLPLLARDLASKIRALTRGRVNGPAFPRWSCHVRIAIIGRSANGPETALRGPPSHANRLGEPEPAEAVRIAWRGFQGRQRPSARTGQASNRPW